MRNIAVVASVALFVVGAFAIACSPFSGSDATSGDASAAADGRTSNGSPDGSVDGGAAPFDFANCAGGVHMAESFDSLPPLPPSGWSDGSYGDGGKLSLELTQKLGKASLKATVVDTQANGVGAAIAYTVPDKITPAAFRVQFAYRPVPVSFTGDIYVELGCDISLAGNTANDAYIARNTDATGIVGFNDTSSMLPLSVVQEGWYHVTQELHLSPANGASNVTLLSAVTPADGGVETATTSATFAGTRGPYQIICGIPFAAPGAKAMPTLDVYVDDIVIDVCP